MKAIKIILLNLVICIVLFFGIGLLYITIYGTGGYYNARRVFFVEIFYFSLGVLHSYILYKKVNNNRKEASIYAIVLLLVYFYMAFIFGKIG